MQIILISGDNGAGKDTFGNMLSNILPNSKIFKFAGMPNSLFKENFNIDYHSLNRTDKEFVRPHFITFSEGYKKIYGDSYWADTLLSQINRSSCDYAIITDLRFQIEINRTIELFPHNTIITHIRKNNIQQFPLSTNLPIHYINNTSDFDNLKIQAHNLFP